MVEIQTVGLDSLARPIVTKLFPRFPNLREKHSLLSSTVPNDIVVKTVTTTNRALAGSSSVSRVSQA